MAGSNKETGGTLKESGESSSNKPKGSPEIPTLALPKKDEMKKGPEEKSKEDPLTTSYDPSDDSESENSGEDPAWMFYDTDDSSCHGSMDEKSDDDQAMIKEARADGEGFADDEPEKKKLKMDDEASLSSQDKEVK